MIASLFPAAVQVAGGPPEAATGALFPAEEEIVAGAVAKRRREFTAGRLYAREALARLGVGAGPILARGRRPVWPAGTLGTIAHTTGRCGAAVVRAADAAGLGLDVEARETVTEEVLRHVLTPPEREWLDSRPATERAGWATLIFSAKEAFYKSLAELREGFVGFHEVRIEPDEAGRFAVVALSDPVLELLQPFEMTGRFVAEEGWLWTGVTLRVRA